jgi:hypothetical protein
MRTLALKDIQPNNPVANTISSSKSLTWINTNPTPTSGTAAQGLVMGSTGNSSVEMSELLRSWEWKYYEISPIDQTIEGIHAKRGSATV